MQHIERVPEFTRRAIKVARTPLGGPVFLQMTEDLIDKEATAKIFPQTKFQVAAKVKPEPERIIEAARMLIESENPLVAVGLEVTKAGALKEMIELSELLALPVTQGLSLFADFPNRHPLSFGAFSRFTGYYRQADLFLMIGAQMPDEGHYIVTGPPPPNAKSIHISLEPGLLASFHPTELSIMADAREAIADLIEAVKSLATKQRIESIRSERGCYIRGRSTYVPKQSLESGAIRCPGYNGDLQQPILQYEPGLCLYGQWRPSHNEKRSRDLFG